MTKPCMCCCPGHPLGSVLFTKVCRAEKFSPTQVTVLKSRLRLTAFVFPPVATVKILNHVAAMWGSEPELAVEPASLLVHQNRCHSLACKTSCRLREFIKQIVTSDPGIHSHPKCPKRHKTIFKHSSFRLPVEPWPSDLAMAKDRSGARSRL